MAGNPHEVLTFWWFILNLPLKLIYGFTTNGGKKEGYKNKNPTKLGKYLGGYEQSGIRFFTGPVRKKVQL